MSVLRSPVQNTRQPQPNTSPSGSTTNTEGGEPKPSPCKPVDVSPKPSEPKQQADRVAEARACLLKAKTHLANSRNLKTEIKTGITEALDRLFQLIKDTCANNAAKIQPTTKPPATDTINSLECPSVIKKLEEHSKLLVENNKKLEDIQNMIQTQNSNKTYASVTALKGGSMERKTLHSVVVSSNNEGENGDQVLEKLRTAMDAKEGWVKIEKVRKAKDRKVIIGFNTKEERDKARNKLNQDKVGLTVKDIENKNPLIILKNVLSANTNEDILKALNNQNRDIFTGKNNTQDKVEIKYRKRARNPHINHIVLSVPPQVWRKAIDAGRVNIDLQRIWVEDQSPLMQCSRCLGYGHSKRYCQEKADLCSHCGGQHLKAECAAWLEGVTPSCQNCKKEKLANVDHNAFSAACSVRRRWDNIARSTIAYC